MRSLWFSLIGPEILEVEDHLRRHGITPIEGHPGELRYPLADPPVLYISCQGYQWAQDYGLQEEYDELLQAIGGAIPTVHVLAHVTGHAPGDAEVRFLAHCLLDQFPGFAFDEYSSYSHAWTLHEIENGSLIDGLRFFDYQGHFDRSRIPP